MLDWLWYLLGYSTIIITDEVTEEVTITDEVSDLIDDIKVTEETPIEPETEEVEEKIVAVSSPITILQNNNKKHFITRR